MEEGEQGKNRLVWLLIVPVAMAAGVLLTKWALRPGRAGRAIPAEKHADAVTPSAAPEAPEPAAADSAGFDLPGDEPARGEAGVIWTNKSAVVSREGTRPAPEAASAFDPRESKKYHGMGLARGVLTGAVEKILNNPKAITALLSNEYVVKGFMSRDTVKNATANSRALANYLKNPANMSKFMGKEAVQRGINNQQLVSAVVSSRLAGALVDTPGGRALLSDPRAIAEVLRANPALVDVLMNPAVLNALLQNPKTAAAVTRVNMAGTLH